MREFAIGIDLGTSKCCVGVVHDGEVYILENERGKKITPSYVAFTDTERLIGDDAKDQALLNPTNTVYGIKRLLGKTREDCEIEREKLYLPFTLADCSKTDSRETSIKVKYRGKYKELSVQNLTAMLLLKMKQVAERRLEGQNVTQAVVSVPAFFDNFRRQAMIEAGRIAGFKNVHLISESLALSIAFADSLKDQRVRKVLIIDCGGGFFAATVAEISKNSVKIIGSFGDDCGGLDLTCNMFDTCNLKIMQEYGASAKDVKAIERLKSLCDHSKPSVSSSIDNTFITVENFEDAGDVSVKMRGSELGQISKDVFENMFLTAAEKVFLLSNWKADEIDQVLFAGDCFKQSGLQEFVLGRLFEGNFPTTTFLEIDAVTRGAAIHASMMDREFLLEKMRVEDILYRNIGYQCCNGQLKSIFHSKETIPLSKTVSLPSSSVFPLVEVVSRVSSLTFSEFGDAKIGDPLKSAEFCDNISFKFEVDANGIVSCLDSPSGQNIGSVSLFHRSDAHTEVKILLEEQFQRDEKEVLFCYCKLDKTEIIMNRVKPAGKSLKNISHETLVENRTDVPSNQSIGHNCNETRRNQTGSSTFSSKKLEKSQNACIGIDLGSSKCCVAVFEKGKVKILENERAKRTTPSYVAFTDARRLVGDEARDKIVLNPKSTIHKFKRLMGENFSKSSTDEFALFSQTSICDRDGQSAFEVSYRGDNIYLYPEQVSAMMLKKMKTMAESYLQSPVEEAVISVPVYFTNEQRKATRIAASVAGFKNTRLINDCMATALAYKDNHKNLIDETNLIVDVGGGGASLAVVRCRSNIIETKGIGGSHKFNGDYFTLCLTDLLIKEIGKACDASDEKNFGSVRTVRDALQLDLNKRPEEKIQVDNISCDSGSISFVNKEHFEETVKDATESKLQCDSNAKHQKIIERVWQASEALKLDLSKGIDKQEVKIDSLFGAFDFTCIVTKKQFEETLMNVVENKMSKIVNELLKTVGIENSAIDNVILVGGSTRIPFLKESLAKIFGYKKLNRTVNADEALAHGALLLPLYSGMYKGYKGIIVSDLVQNCLYPKYDSNIWMKIPPHDQVITICGQSLVLDNSGIVSINELCVEQLPVDTLKQENDRLDRDDEEYEVMSLMLNDLDSLCYKTEAALDKKGSPLAALSGQHKSEIRSLCGDVLSWIDDREIAPICDIEEKRRSLTEKIAAIQEEYAIEEVRVTEIPSPAEEMPRKEEIKLQMTSDCQTSTEYSFSESSTDSCDFCSESESSLESTWKYLKNIPVFGFLFRIIAYIIPDEWK